MYVTDLLQSANVHKMWSLVEVQQQQQVHHPRPTYSVMPLCLPACLGNLCMAPPCQPCPLAEKHNVEGRRCRGALSINQCL